MEEAKKQGFSFGFSKKKDSSKLQKSAIKDEDANAREENAAFVDSFDGKQLHSNRKEKKDLVIPLISTNRWQKPLKPEDFDQETDDKKERHVKTVDGNTIDSEAANELLKEAANREHGSDEEKEKSTFTVPLLMANKVPEGFETDERLDVSLRPEGSIEADYAEVPIEDYGFAMLRGMGWTEGTGIGKKGRLAKPVEAVLRPKGMGLGADRNLAKQNAQEAESGDSEAAKLTCKKGVNCVITNGKHKDLYGTVEGVDEDNSRVVVKMALSKESITISQFAARLVTKKDYNQNSKVLNKAKVDKYKDEENKKNEKRKDYKDREDKHGDRERGDERDRRRRDEPKEKKRKHDESSSSSSSKHHKSSSQSQKRMWLRPSLRVRIVDPEYKKGKYFKTKVIIEDVIDQGVCICRTEEGKVLENVYQSMLETVIPRSQPSYVMIVAGKHTGKLGELLRKDKGTSEAVIQLLEDRDMAVSLRFDDICDYTGNIDDDFNY